MLSWEQKLLALDALGGRASIGIRAPGDWFCHHSIEIKDKHVLKGGSGNGKTVEEAVIDEWRMLVEDLLPHEYLIARAMGKDRRAVLWNGFMWEDVNEQARAA